MKLATCPSVAALALLLAGPLAAEDRFVAPLPAGSAVEMRSGLVYAERGEARLAFDLYLPARRPAAVPVVVFLNGIGADWIRGHVQYTSWGRAVTARGLAGVTMDSREEAVAEDLAALLAHLRAHAGELGVDAERVALWSCSANARRGVPLSASLAGLSSAVVYYGTGEVESFRRDRPILFARAGLDNPDLNRSIDALVARALADDAPVELINLAAGQHGFDVRDDDEASRAAIARTLDFLEGTLHGGVAAAARAGAPKAEAAAAVYRQDWAAAARAYESLAAASPDDPIARERLGAARAELGDRAGALDAYEAALALDSPNRGRVSFATVGLLVDLGEVDRAVARLGEMKRWLRFFAPALRQEERFAPLRADPRLEEILADVPPPPR